LCHSWLSLLRVVPRLDLLRASPWGGAGWANLSADDVLASLAHCSSVTLVDLACGLAYGCSQLDSMWL
jgi:hypothetical protein